MHELIRDITLCILFAWMLGLLAHFSRQPLILAYLIAGFCIGPFGAAPMSLVSWVQARKPARKRLPGMCGCVQDTSA